MDWISWTFVLGACLCCYWLGRRRERRRFLSAPPYVSVPIDDAETRHGWG